MADAIPNYPKIVIQLYDEHNGEVRIQGAHRPVVGQDAREECLQLAVATARDLGRPVKATAQDPDGTSYPLIVHPDGEIEAVEAVKKKNPFLPLFIAGGAVAVLGIAAAVYFVFFYRPTPPPPPDPYLPQLSAPPINADRFIQAQAPVGYGVAASWAVTMADNTTPAISPDGKHLAVVSAQNNYVTVINQEGKVEFQVPFPSQAVGPAFAVIDGRQSVYVIDGSTLRWWTTDGKLPAHEATAPSGFTIQGAGTSTPIAVNDGHNGGYVIKGGTWQAVDASPFERQATFLLGDSQRVLIASTAGQAWWLSPGKAAQALPLRAVTNGQAVSVQASPGHIVITWQDTRSGQDIRSDVVVYNAYTGADIAQTGWTSQQSGGAGQTPTWVPSSTPNGTVAATNNFLFDLARHRAVAVAGLTPVVVSGGFVYGGTENGNVAVATTSTGALARVTQPTDVQGNTAALPWAVFGGRAIVVADTDAGPSLYALDKASGRQQSIGGGGKVEDPQPIAWPTPGTS